MSFGQRRVLALTKRHVGSENEIVIIEKEVAVVHRGSYNNNKCIIVCLTM